MSVSSPYSCWPVIVNPYNPSPEMCMTKLFMFLMCLISGPSNPKASIEVYLEPLIDDFNKLWSGIWTYDVVATEIATGQRIKNKI